MKAKSTLILIITLVLIALTATVSYYGVGENKNLSAENIKLGLDLAGGVSITYEADIENPSEAEMDSAISLIRKRLDFNNYTEAEAYQEGTNRIHVEIPGVSDPNKAVSDIGQTAQLRFVGMDYAKLEVDEDGKTEEIKDMNELIGKIGEEVLTGADIADASKQIGALSATSQNEAYVQLKLNSEGTIKFKEATEKYVGKNIAIMLDDKIISNPRVNSVISGGEAIITGMANPEEAENLAALIRAGALPFKLTPIQANGVGATLGMEAINSSVMACTIGGIIILAFMMFYYRIPGVAASIALVFYAAAVLVLINLFNLTLTLPGVAGIILSIGMAVDANVIIFSRIKEELKAGKGVRASIDAGFKKALSAIVDGNVTTLIAASILWWLGTGPIKGFAQTLALGIVVSMFTALVVTRIIIKQFINLGIKQPKLYGAK